jgi:SAM-dependent methyltransferase
MLYHHPEAAIAAPRGALELRVCTRCAFVFNAAFDPAKVRYGKDYDNTQTCSPCFAEYVGELARHLLTTKGIQNSRIVEVGCGKGHFLRRLVEEETMGNRGYGFDPSYLGPESEEGGRLLFRKQLYGPDCTDVKADLVVCRHVIEHVPRPVSLLDSIRRTLDPEGTSLVACETPCVEWILRNKVVWDFFHEHCSYFSAGSLIRAMQQAGLQVEAVTHVFGDQYLWLEARTRVETPVLPWSEPAEIVGLCQEYTRWETRLISEWRGRLAELAQRGGVAFWGAGAKGVTLANLLDPQRVLVTCVVDLNPRKQGCFLPGTGHPIVDFKELRAYGVKMALQMNPNYTEENLLLLRAAELDVTLVDPHDWRVIQ